MSIYKNIIEKISEKTQMYKFTKKIYKTETSFVKNSKKKDKKGFHIFYTIIFLLEFSRKFTANDTGASHRFQILLYRQKFVRNNCLLLFHTEYRYSSALHKTKRRYPVRYYPIILL